jgi:dephospho-CoA kinase
VILVGLTGGIGSGKSTVSARLAARGAVIVDADAITRQVQAPGSPVVQAMAERFGDSILQPDGSLDRAAVAALVFGDAGALADLNAIVHPAVGAEMDRLVAEQSSTDRVVVLDVPLLVERPRPGLAATIVVDVPTELAIERLVSARGMDEADARARMARQATREERLARADRVVDNSGSLAELDRQLDEVWSWLVTLDHVGPRAKIGPTNDRRGIGE